MLVVVATSSAMGALSRLDLRVNRLGTQWFHGVLWRGIPVRAQASFCGQILCFGGFFGLVFLDLGLWAAISPAIRRGVLAPLVFARNPLLEARESNP